MTPRDGCAQYMETRLLIQGGTRLLHGADEHADEHADEPTDWSPADIALLGNRIDRISAPALADRGRIAKGCRPDLVLVELAAAGSARLVATIAAGRLVYCAEPARLTMTRTYSLAA